MRKSLFEVQILVRGRPIQEYPHGSDNWVEGRRGSEYTLRIRNLTSARILVVPSVDGLSAMTGKLASASDQGYVIGANSHVDVPGWRLDSDRVAKFVFGGAGESYAAQMDRPENIGVIGVACFRERAAVAMRSAFYLNAGSHTFGGGGGDFLGATTRGAPSLGTGFGRQAEHRVTEVTFDRATTVPAETIEVRYATRAELEQRGVNLRPTTEVERRPSAFPADPQNGCPPPAGWRG